MYEVWVWVWQRMHSFIVLTKKNWWKQAAHSVRPEFGVTLTRIGVMHFPGQIIKSINVIFYVILKCLITLLLAVIDEMHYDFFCEYSSVNIQLSHSKSDHC